MERPLSDKNKKAEVRLVRKAAAELRRVGITEESRDRIFREVFGSVLVDPTISARVWDAFRNR